MINTNLSVDLTLLKMSFSIIEKKFFFKSLFKNNYSLNYLIFHIFFILFAKGTM